MTRSSRSLLLYSLWFFLVAGVLCSLGCRKAAYLDTVRQSPYLAMPGQLDQLHYVDLSRLRTRDNYPDLLAALESDQQINQVLTAMRERVGFDLTRQLDVVALGLRPVTDKKQPWKSMIVVAKGQFDSPAVKLEQLRTWLGEEYLVSPPPFKASTNDGVKRYQTTAQSQFNENVVLDLCFGFPSTELMIFTFSPALLDETLAVVNGDTPGLQKDQAWLAMLARPNLGALAWGTGNVPRDPNSPLGKLSAANTGIKQYYYDVDMLQDLTAELGLVCVDIDTATKTSGILKSSIDAGKMVLAGLMAQQGTQAPQTVNLLGKLVITTELQVSKVMIKLTPDERQALVTEWRALGPKLEAARRAVQPGAAPTAPPAAPR